VHRLEELVEDRLAGVQRLRHPWRLEELVEDRLAGVQRLRHPWRLEVVVAEEVVQSAERIAPWLRVGNSGRPSLRMHRDNLSNASCASASPPPVSIPSA
jgi:hypothetical protein